MGVVRGCARAAVLAQWPGPPPTLCVNLLSAKTFFIAAILLRENEDVGIVSFYSVIYNFVPRTYNYTIKLCAIVESDLSSHGKN